MYEEEVYDAGDSFVTDSCVFKECTSNGEWNDGIGCLLSDDETCVADGYSGNDAETITVIPVCSSGSLICTLMACQDETSCVMMKMVNACLVTVKHV